MPTPSLERIVDTLAHGAQLRATDFVALSDLDRSDAAYVRQRWLEIPLTGRQLLLDEAYELAEDDLSLDFTVLGRIGLSDPDPGVRLRAIQALWESVDPDAGDLLAGLVESEPDADVRAAAARSLFRYLAAAEYGRLDPALAQRMVRALLAAVEAGDGNLRAAAVEALGPSGDPRVGDLLEAAYESGDPALRLAAIRSMGHSARDRWVEYIAEQLTADDPELRFEAAVAAGNLGSEDLVTALGEALGDDDAEVLFAVIEALGEIGGEEAVELLEAYLPGAPPGLDSAIEAALENARGGHFRRFGELL
jgi:HEAT repeat protein